MSSVYKDPFDPRPQVSPLSYDQVSPDRLLAEEKLRGPDNDPGDETDGDDE